MGTKARDLLMISGAGIAKGGYGQCFGKPYNNGRVPPLCRRSKPGIKHSVHATNAQSPPFSLL